MNKKTKKIINIVLLIIWCSVIFMFSHQNGSESTSTSVGFMETIISFINKITNNMIDVDSAEKLIKSTFVIIRKCAHIAEFLILGVLILNVFKDYLILDKKVIILSLLFSFLYACSDEFHQLFIIGRSGQFKDILIDTFGSIIGVFGYYHFLKR